MHVRHCIISNVTVFLVLKIDASRHLSLTVCFTVLTFPHVIIAITTSGMRDLHHGGQNISKIITHPDLTYYPVLRIT